MSIGLYMDVHVPGPITQGLRLRDVDVITAQEDGTDTLHDPHLLDRATRLGRVLITQDDGLLGEAVDRQRRGEDFSGIIYAHQQAIPLGWCIQDLELIAQACDPEDVANRIIYLPLK